MPGIAMHLRFGKLVAELIGLKDSVQINRFFQGNLIPDMFDDKSKTHLYKNYTDMFDVPDMEKVLELFRIHLEKPEALGAYCHLYLDERYTKDILVPSFIWDVEKRNVVNPATGYTATREEFYYSKDSGLYAAYTSMNPMFIKDCGLDINSISEELGMTGIELYDSKRRKQTWKEELNGYLAQAETVKYTGKVLDYYWIISKFEEFAKDLAMELKELNLVVA